MSTDRNDNLISFREAGIVTFSDVEQYLDIREFDTMEAAADLIEQMNLRELLSIAPMLRQARVLTQEKLERVRS